jgi:hypothetical protein
MSYRIASWLVCTSFSLGSCDVAHTIMVKNKTFQPAQVSWREAMGNQQDSLCTIRLSPRGKVGSRTELYYGFGYWDKAELARVAQQMERIEIRTAADTVRVTGPAAIGEFLRPTRRGVFRNYLVIRIR